MTVVRSLNPPNENDKDDAARVRVPADGMAVGFAQAADQNQPSERVEGVVLELRMDAANPATGGTNLSLYWFFGSRQKVQELIDELQTLAQQLPPQ